MERVFSKQQDWLARAVCIPTVALLASHVVFTKQFPWQTNYHFPTPYFLTVATVMLCCWEVNVRLFLWMDTRIPFYLNPTQRIGRQVSVNGVATMMTFGVVFPLAQLLYTGRWPGLSMIMVGMVVCATIATIVNGAYIALYLTRTIYWEKAQSEVTQNQSLEEREPRASDLVRVEINNGQLFLTPQEIAYFYSTGGMVLLVKTDGKKVTTNYQSLAQFVEQLPNAYFFSLSRQIVAGVWAIKAVKDDVNRKLVVSLVPSLYQNQTAEEVVVSRYRSGEFKKWLANASAQ